MIALKRLLAAIAAAMALALPASGKAGEAQGQGPCREITFRGIGYTICKAKPEDDLRLWLRDENGRTYGGFSRLNEALAREGRALAFAMNAGMFHSDRSPVGLYVENGREITPLADGGSYGNFGLKPNGVFCAGAGRFRVIETNRFRKDPPPCTYATQSGPMLLIEGRIHPRFLVNATSRHIRNGVGVSEDGKLAIFAISNQPVTFHEFASFYREGLGLTDALYFDGKISRLHAPGLGRSDTGFLPLGPIIGVTAPAPALDQAAQER